MSQLQIMNTADVHFGSRNAPACRTMFQFIDYVLLFACLTGKKTNKNNAQSKSYTCKNVQETQCTLPCRSPAMEQVCSMKMLAFTGCLLILSEWLTR